MLVAIVGCGCWLLLSVVVVSFCCSSLLLLAVVGYFYPLQTAVC